MGGARVTDEQRRPKMRPSELDDDRRLHATARLSADWNHAFARGITVPAVFSMPCGPDVPRGSKL